MDTITIDLEIYSPRWGHNDTYTLELSNDELIITQGARTTKATYRENLDPEWSGEPLVGTLQNDQIYPPEIFQSLVERAWLAWRNGELTNASIEEELNALTDWLNVITNSKPKTKFWNAYF